MWSEDLSWSDALADHWLVVLVAYLAVGIPLNFYIYHDVIDKRWRSVEEVRKHSIRYCALASAALVLLVAYGLLQFAAGDYKEGGAACLSCAIAVYGLYLRRRQVAILRFFHQHLQRRATSIIKVYKPETNRISDQCALLFPNGGYGQGPVNGHISAVFLDDNYPGEGPRVTWLQRQPTVKDWTEMTVRTGLWVRLAVLPSSLSFDTALRPSSTLYGAMAPTHLDTSGAWTIDVVQQQFLASGERRSMQGGPEGPLDAFIECLMGKRGTRSVLRETLRLAPESEWSQALSEFPSRWIEGLEAKGVAWDVYLALVLHPAEAMGTSDGGLYRSLIHSLPEQLSEYLGGVRSKNTSQNAVPESLSRLRGTGNVRELEQRKEEAEHLIRTTLGDDGYVTAAVLMTGFPQKHGNTQPWLDSVLDLCGIWHRLAMMVTTGTAIMETKFTEGVDLVVALALLLGADKRSFDFSHSTGQGMNDALKGRHKHVLEHLQGGEAEKVLKTSLQRGLEVNMPALDMAELRHNLGMFLQNRGKRNEALQHFKIALATRRQALGRYHPDTVKIKNSIRWKRKGTHRIDETASELQQSLRAWLDESKLGVGRANQCVHNCGQKVRDVSCPVWTVAEISSVATSSSADCCGAGGIFQGIRLYNAVTRLWPSMQMGWRY